jgi:hypothetical protein
VSILKTTITLDDVDHEVEVTYAYHGPIRGQRDSLGGIRGAGPPLEPDEPASVEIESVMMHSPTFHNRENREDILDTIPKRDLDWLEGKCLDDARERREAAEEARWEDREDR